MTSGLQQNWGPSTLTGNYQTSTLVDFSGMKRRISLVDDHPMSLEGLAAIVARQPDLEVFWLAHTPAEAISKLSKDQPDLLVTDLAMPGRSGLDFLKDIQAIRPDLAVLVLSMHDEVFFAERALQAGARGYLMKDANPAQVLEAVRVVLSGKIYVSPNVSSRLVEAATGHRPRGSTSPIEKLTDREFEVFRLIGQGKTTPQIAEQLHVSPKTIGVHRIHIKEKLDLKDATSMMLFAVRWLESQDKKG